MTYYVIYKTAEFADGKKEVLPYRIFTDANHASKYHAKLEATEKNGVKWSFSEPKEQTHSEAEIEKILADNEYCKFMESKAK